MNCCEVMRLVLERETPGKGLASELMFNVKTGESKDVPTIRFRKHKRSDSEFSAKFRNATLAEVKFCPFCGKKAASAGGVET